MAIAKLRGDQLKPGILRDSHIGADAAIDETKLSIDWSKHTETLTAKKLLYKVQLDDIAVGGLTEFDITSLVSGSAVTSNSTDEGILIDAPKNKVTLRDGTTQDTPLKDVHAHVVFGRIVENGTGGFKIKFFTDENGVETPYEMAEGQTIDAFFYKRGNLLNVPEDYAITDGGSFVEGATDAQAEFDLQQLAKEIGITLNHDGNMTLSRSVIEEILVQTRGLTNTTVRASDVIDEVVTARNGKSSLGSELTAIRQSVSDEVQARTQADKDLSDRLDAVEGGAGASNEEIVAARGSHADLKARLDADYADLSGKVSTEKSRAESAEARIEGKVDQTTSDLANYQTTNNSRVADLENSLGELSVDVGERIGTAIEQVYDRAIAEEARIEAKVDQEIADRTAEVEALRNRVVELEKEASKLHQHDRLVFQALGNETSVTLPDGKFADANTLTVTINGLENAPGIHYSEVLDGEGKVTGIDFAPDKLVPGDVVIIKWLNVTDKY